MKRKLWFVALGNLSDSFIAATIHCREDVRGLTKLGWDATLFSQANSKIDSHKDFKEVVVCKNRPLIYRLVFELKLILRLLFFEKPDFVLMRGMGLFFFSMMLWFLRIPYGNELCGPPYCFLNNGPWWNISYRTDKFILKRASIIIALTQELANLSKNFIRLETLVAITGVGVDVNSYKFENNPPSTSDFILGFMGTLYENRGLETAFNAMICLHDKGINTKMIIVGDGAFRKKAEQITIDLGISDKVIFRGYVPPSAVGVEMAQCDLTVAFYEHTPELTIGGINPMKVWTSLAIGKPVLLHNPGTFDAYNDIPGIFSCPATEPKEVAEMLRKIWNDNGKNGLANAGLEGRKYITENITWLGHAKVIDETICKRLNITK